MIRYFFIFSFILYLFQCSTSKYFPSKTSFRYWPYWFFFSISYTIRIFSLVIQPSRYAFSSRQAIWRCWCCSIVLTKLVVSTNLSRVPVSSQVNPCLSSSTFRVYRRQKAETFAKKCQMLGAWTLHSFVECKRVQRSRWCFWVEWNSVEEFSDTP